MAKGPSKKKACEILKHGKVRKKKLTKRQRGFMAIRCKGRKGRKRKA